LLQEWIQPAESAAHPEMISDSFNHLHKRRIRTLQPAGGGDGELVDPQRHEFKVRWKPACQEVRLNKDDEGYSRNPPGDYPPAPRKKIQNFP